MRVISLVLCTLFLSNFAEANWQRIPVENFSLKNPPRAGSKVEADELAELHDLEDSRTKDDCALAREQRFPTFEAFFGPQMRILTRDEYYQAKPIMDAVSKASERVAAYFKGEFERVRPFNRDRSLRPCAHKPGGDRSYPSGHATIAVTDACILAQMFPRKAREIRNAGDYYARLRNLVGVHFPSDVEAGKSLGNAICEHLLSDQDFQKELANHR